MAHMINSMAYTGKTPWHGLGNQLTPGASIDTWIREAGLDWELRWAHTQFTPAHDAARPGELLRFEGQRVLYRSDTAAPLAVVSERFKPVQPRDVVEFFRAFAEAGHMTIETAGCLRGGATLWALARTSNSIDLGGDVVGSYYLLTTANDGTAATCATATSVRVVCANTLRQALGAADNAIHIRHTARFDPAVVSRKLAGSDEQWATFAQQVRLLANTRLARKDVAELTRNLFELADDQVETHRGYHKVMSLFAGRGLGSRMDSTAGTAWGWVNAVTEYTDHHAVQRSPGGRLHSAWLGAGDRLKTRAAAAAAATAA